MEPQVSSLKSCKRGVKSMTETVAVALITFSSGVVGAIIGGITAYKVAKFSANRSIKQTLHIEKQQAYAELIESYERFVGALAASMINEAWLEDIEERTLFMRFQSAYAKAILICSENAVPQLNLLLKSVSRFATDRKIPDDLASCFNQVVTSMRKELHEDVKQHKNRRKNSKQ